MAYCDIRTLRRAEKLRLRGKVDEAVRILSAVAEKIGSARVLIRRGLLTGSVTDLKAAVSHDPKSGAALFFLGVRSYEDGDLDMAGQYISSALKVAPDNISAQVMSALISLKSNSSLESLLALGENYTAATTKTKALLLMEIESQIAARAPKDCGAKEREHLLGGFFGFIFDLMDDVAVWGYWLIYMVPTFFLFAINKTRAQTKKMVLDGIRLEGLRKPSASAEKFRSILNMDAKNVDALEFLTRYHMEREEWGEASSFLARLTKTTEGETYPILSRWRADILFAEKHHDDAMKLYIQVEGEFALDYIVPYRKGLCALAMGDTASARSSFEATLSQPNPDIVRERFVKLSELMNN